MIRIDSQALNLLLSTPPPALAVCSADPSLSCKEQLYDDCIRKEKRADGDDASVGTAETVWSDDTEESDDEDNDDDLTRRVCFVEPLVTEEWTREYTPQSDVAALYYSSEDTTRFRQEYRLERQVLSDLCIKSDELPDAELFSDMMDAKQQGKGRHQISRVVVLHNDRFQAFGSLPNVEAVAPPDESFSATDPLIGGGEDFPDSDNFFDSDSFWSGAVTWY